MLNTIQNYGMINYQIGLQRKPVSKWVTVHGNKFVDKLKHATSTEQYRPNIEHFKTIAFELPYVNQTISSIESNIDIASLKSDNYTEPLKKDFKSLKQARAYAKERVINAIKSKNPHEHMVIIHKKTNTVLGEYRGTEHEVNIDLLDANSLPKDISIVHSHPTTVCIINGNPVSTPVSWDDYAFLSERGEDVIAFDINGKFSMLAKKKDFKSLPENKMKAYRMLLFEYKYPKEKYLHIILEKLPIEFKDVKSYRELYERLGMFQKAGQLTDKIKKAFASGLDEVEQSTFWEEQLRGLDRFWRDNADKLGVVYKTNYEWLIH